MAHSTGDKLVKIRVQVVVEYEDETETTLTEDISVLTRTSDADEQLGLTLAESKELLTALQETMITHQLAETLRPFGTCTQCGKSLRCNGRQHITYRTLFGNFKLSGQRYYHCACHEQAARSFSPIATVVPERTAPEFAFMQAKWASLMSYGLTADLLEDVLPVKVNVATASRKLRQAAQRLEDELGDEQHVYASGCLSEWADLPDPNDRLFVGIDGGFVRGREGESKKSNQFEVIVGKSLLAEHDSKRFAFVQTYDEKPKRRLFEMLKSQGMQMNQDITFVSDGADDVRDLQYFLNPNAEHLLDWFHITMKLTVMKQIAKGIEATKLQNEMLATIDRIKHRLWHGHVETALWSIDDLFVNCETAWDEEADMEIEQTDPKCTQLAEAADSFNTYIRNNACFIPNYAERHRYGELISSSFAESAINEIVSKRMVKKQQMRWTKEGAHMLLQVRVKTLNDELRSKYEEWYPSLRHRSESIDSQMIDANAALQHTV